MKRFSDIQKKSKIKKFNEDANLPSNYGDMSKEELLKLLQGGEAQSQAQSETESQAQNEEEPKQHLGEGSNPGKLFSKLFESREMAHIYHLQVNGDMGSHAKHTALGEYYDGILKRKYTLRYGEKEGLYEEWWETDKKWVEYTYREGKKDGKYKLISFIIKSELSVSLSLCLSVCTLFRRHVD